MNKQALLGFVILVLFQQGVQAETSMFNDQNIQLAPGVTHYYDLVNKGNIHPATQLVLEDGVIMTQADGQEDTDVFSQLQFDGNQPAQ